MMYDFRFMIFKTISYICVSNDELRAYWGIIFGGKKDAFLTQIIISQQALIVLSLLSIQS